MESHFAVNKVKPGKVMFALLLAGLVCGTLDALCAILINYKIPAEKVWIFVASGVYGKAALQAPASMMMMGLIFHYLIAFTFSSILILCYPVVKMIFRNQYLIGVLYGVFVWSIMNLLVVPLSNTAKTHFHISNALLNILVLILAVGLPASIIGHRLYFSKKS